MLFSLLLFITKLLSCISSKLVTILAQCCIRECVFVVVYVVVVVVVLLFLYIFRMSEYVITAANSKRHPLLLLAKTAMFKITAGKRTCFKQPFTLS